MSVYCIFKKTFEVVMYSVTVKNNALRRHSTCYRLSLHRLEIEIGIYNDFTRANIICNVCTSGMI